MDSIFLFINLICAVVIIVLVFMVSAMHKKLATDELTGLKTRKELLKFIDRKLSKLGEDESITVSMIDLDDFKKINDTHGHMEGDRRLAEFAGELKKTCREIDEKIFVSRYGGDEFVIVGTDIHAAESVEKALKEISDLSFSMGMTDVSGTDTEGALAAADREMYRKKRK